MSQKSCTLRTHATLYLVWIVKYMFVHSMFCVNLNISVCILYIWCEPWDVSLYFSIFGVYSEIYVYVLYIWREQWDIFLYTLHLALPVRYMFVYSIFGVNSEIFVCTRYVWFQQWYICSYTLHLNSEVYVCTFHTWCEKWRVFGKPKADFIPILTKHKPDVNDVIKQFRGNWTSEFMWCNTKMRFLC